MGLLIFRMFQLKAKLIGVRLKNSFVYVASSVLTQVTSVKLVWLLFYKQLMNIIGMQVWN